MLSLKKRLSLFLLSAAAGVLAGISSAVFLYLLEGATHLRQATPFLIFLLPLGGLLIGLLYHYGAGRAGQGHNLILDEIHKPTELVPARMAPFVLIGTLVTHLLGGSAGREGTAVQMGASLADQLGLLFKLSREERRSLLMAGAGAGFGAAIGAPIAGVIFGMEVVRAGRLRIIALAECAVASLTATAITLLLRAPHTHYPHAELPGFEWHLPILVILAGGLFGLAARSFVFVEHKMASAFTRLLKFPPLRPLCGGVLLSALFYWEGSLRFCGLGIETIQAALASPASVSDPFLKLGFTALTLSAGFKGGEFIPLVFIGATLGSAIAAFLGLPLPLFASLGFAAVFGAGANTPIACAVMAAELFGWGILPWALPACYVAYLVSGHPGIYRAQPRDGHKQEGFFSLAGSLRDLLSRSRPGA